MLHFRPGNLFTAQLKHALQGRTVLLNGLLTAIVGMRTWMRRHPNHQGRLGRMPRSVFDEKLKEQVAERHTRKRYRDWLWDNRFCATTVILGVEFVDFAYWDDYATRVGYQKFKDRHAEHKRTQRAAAKGVQVVHRVPPPPARRHRRPPSEASCGMSTPLTFSLDSQDTQHRASPASIEAPEFVDLLSPEIAARLAEADVVRQGELVREEAKEAERTARVERSTAQFLAMVPALRPDAEVADPPEPAAPPKEKPTDARRKPEQDLDPELWRDPDGIIQQHFPEANYRAFRATGINTGQMLSVIGQVLLSRKHEFANPTAALYHAAKQVAAGRWRSSI